MWQKAADDHCDNLQYVRTPATLCSPGRQPRGSRLRPNRRPRSTAVDDPHSLQFRPVKIKAFQRSSKPKRTASHTALQPTTSLRSTTSPPQRPEPSESPPEPLATPYNPWRPQNMSPQPFQSSAVLNTALRPCTSFHLHDPPSPSARPRPAALVCSVLSYILHGLPPSPDTMALADIAKSEFDPTRAYCSAWQFRIRPWGASRSQDAPCQPCVCPGRGPHKCGPATRSDRSNFSSPTHNG